MRARTREPEAGSKKLVFAYDYLGRRIRKQVFDWDPAANENVGAWETSPTTDLRFVYDGWNLLMELDGLNSNAVLRKYTWGLDLSGTLQGAGGVGGLLAVYDTAGTTSTSDDASYGYLYDTNGNVGQLVDFSDGSLAAKYEYDPYGGPLLDAANASVSGSYAATNLFRFSTKYFDGEVDYSGTTNDGLYYYGYRYYSPRLGRWLSRDPMMEEEGPNLLSFVFNNPVDILDLDGLQTNCEPWAKGRWLVPLRLSGRVEILSTLVGEEDFDDDFRWGFRICPGGRLGIGICDRKERIRARVTGTYKCTIHLCKPCETTIEITASVDVTVTKEFRIGMGITTAGYNLWNILVGAKDLVSLDQKYREALRQVAEFGHKVDELCNQKMNDIISILN